MMKNLKKYRIVLFLLISYSLNSQWGIAYNEGWGNRDLKSYPNFFSSIDYVGDGINGHRLDIYFPTSMKVNLNNLSVLALNKKYDEINKVSSLIENENKKYPCMIVIYGSAWRGNSGKDGSLNHIKNAVKKLLKNDFIIVTLNHRSSISHPFPAQIHDVKAAIRFLKGNAKALSIDPNFIAIQGYSSGGHLAAFMGASSGKSEFNLEGKKIDLNGSLGNHLDQNSDVHAVVDWYGPTDLSQMNDCSKIVRQTPNRGDARNLFIGGPVDENKVLTQLANPITYLDSKTPPFLIFHGAKDTAVPVCQSEILHDALIDLGLKSRLIIEDEGVHSGTNGKMFAQKNLDIMTEFIINEYSKGKAAR